MKEIGVVMICLLSGQFMRVSDELDVNNVSLFMLVFQ